jgi:hypothetical protein
MPLSNDDLTVNVTPVGEPAALEPIDVETERRALKRIFDFADSVVPISAVDVRTLGVPFTPWIAQQLAAAAAALDDQDDVIPAINTAMVSVVVARESEDQRQLMSSLLNAGNILFKRGAGDRDWRQNAREFYEMILDSPFAEATNERIGAHLGLANYHCSSLEDGAGASHRAAYHFDQLLPFIDRLLDAEARTNVIQRAAATYLSCSDAAGALFCLQRLNPQKALALEEKLRSERPTIDQALLIVSRLHGLGSHDSANKIHSAWMNSVQLKRRRRWHLIKSQWLSRFRWPWKKNSVR